MCITKEDGSIETYCNVKSVATIIPFKERTVTAKINIIKDGRPTPKMPNLTVREKTFKRHFMMSYYNRYDWLTGCSEMNVLFCWPCLLFGKEKTEWNSKGFYYLKNISQSTRHHGITPRHIAATKAFADFINENRVCQHDIEKSGLQIRPHMCRLCRSLNDSNESLLDETKTKLRMWVEANLNIKIDGDPSLPTKICWACSLFVQQWQSFVCQVKESQSSFDESLRKLQEKELSNSLDDSKSLCKTSVKTVQTNQNVSSTVVLNQQTPINKSNITFDKKTLTYRTLDGALMPPTAFAKTTGVTAGQQISTNMITNVTLGQSTSTNKITDDTVGQQTSTSNTADDANSGQPCESSETPNLVLVMEYLGYDAVGKMDSSNASFDELNQDSLTTQVDPLLKSSSDTSLDAGCEPQGSNSDPVISYDSNELTAPKRKSSNDDCEITSKRVQLEENTCVPNTSVENTALEPLESQEIKAESSDSISAKDEDITMESLEANEIKVEITDLIDIKDEELVEDAAIPDTAPYIGTDEHCDHKEASGVLISEQCLPSTSIACEHLLSDSVKDIAPCEQTSTDDDTHIGFEEVFVNSFEFKDESDDENDHLLSETNIDRLSHSNDESHQDLILLVENTTGIQQVQESEILNTRTIVLEAIPCAGGFTSRTTISVPNASKPASSVNTNVKKTHQVLRRVPSILRKKRTM